MTDSTRRQATSDPPKSVRPRIIRRRYLIDPKRQLRTVVMATTLVAILVILVNLGFAFLRSSQTSFLSAAAPQLTPVIERQDSIYWLIMVVMSIVLVVGVMLKTVVETHHTAGAVFAVGQRLDRVSEGDLQVVLRLRKGDNLQNLEGPFNEMVSSLRDRALEEASTLDELAREAEVLGAEGANIARTLHSLAHRKRQIGT